MMTRHLLIAGHGELQNGGFDTGATGYIPKGEHRYMEDDLFPHMKKYTDDSEDTFIFHSAYKVLDRGNLNSLTKKHNADTVTEFHYDSYTANSHGGHVIVHDSFQPDQLDLKIRDVINSMVGLRFEHRGHEGIDGRTNLGMVNSAKRHGINFRLVELGFGSNPDEAKILVEQVDEYARQLVQAYDNTTHDSKPEEPSTTQPSVKQLADRVLASGKTGNTARANYLGMSLDEYEPVRQEINRRYGTTSTTETKRSTEELANIIEASGITGNKQRADYLGMSLDDYEPVRQEINRRYGSSSGSNGSVKELADKVLKTNITGNKQRADYLGMTLDEYEPVRQEINRRFS